MNGYEVMDDLAFTLFHLPRAGFDPSTLRSEVRGFASELPSHLEEDALLPHMETEALQSYVEVFYRMLGFVSLVTKASL